MEQDKPIIVMKFNYRGATSIFSTRYSEDELHVAMYDAEQYKQKGQDHLHAEVHYLGGWK